MLDLSPNGIVSPGAKPCSCVRPSQWQSFGMGHGRRSTRFWKTSSRSSSAFLSTWKSGGVPGDYLRLFAKSHSVELGDANRGNGFRSRPGAVDTKSQPSSNEGPCLLLTPLTEQFMGLHGKVLTLICSCPPAYLLGLGAFLTCRDPAARGGVPRR
jgi:hypothetical protein